MFDDLNRFIAPFFVAVTVFSSFCAFGYFMDDKIDRRDPTNSFNKAGCYCRIMYSGLDERSTTV